MLRIQSGISFLDTASFTRQLFSATMRNVVTIAALGLAAISALVLAFITYKNYQSSIKHKAAALLSQKKKDEAAQLELKKQEKATQTTTLDLDAEYAKQFDQQWNSETSDGTSNTFFTFKDRPTNFPLNQKNSTSVHTSNNIQENTFKIANSQLPVESDEEKIKRKEEEASELAVLALIQSDLNDEDRTSNQSTISNDNNHTSDSNKPTSPSSVNGQTLFFDPSKIKNDVDLIKPVIQITGMSLEPTKQPPLDTPNFSLRIPIQTLPIDKFEKIYTEITEKVFTDPTFSAVTALKSILSPSSEFGRKIPMLLAEIKKRFESKFSNELNQTLNIGDKVPTYFASNSGFETETEKKYRSLVGMCNLFENGPSIIDDLRDTKFLGGIDHYKNLKTIDGKRKGLHAFKYFTGNTVDLDIELHEKDPQKALDKAKKLIIEFGKTCGLKGKGGAELTAEDVNEQLPGRLLHLPQSTSGIHNSGQSHTDRSNHGIWIRKKPNSSVTHYHVNVPNIELVMLATLKLPYMLAELADKAKHFEGGKHYDDFIEAFFKDGLSTQCFNDKALTMIDFHMKWKAKLEGVLSPVEDARKKIEDGTFGDAIKTIGADYALKHVQTQNILTDLLDKAKLLPEIEMIRFSILDEDDWIDRLPTFEEWSLQEKDKIRNFLIQKGLWMSALFQTQLDEKSDYFLLNEGTLNSFMKTFYITETTPLDLNN